jgi:tRNA (guanine10-N2)-methyltransferase
LVFFLPTVTEEYEEVDIYAMLCEGMDVIANSLQDFGSWGRRVSRPLPFFLYQSPADISFCNNS